jgi:hypothetical protein
VARNAALSLVTTPYTFLIDGDILYVPGTLGVYRAIIENPAVGDLNPACVGYHNETIRELTGQNGIGDRAKADLSLKLADSFTVQNWFPMAWTQYGLFKSEPLKALQFVTKSPFDEPGHGFEDDWLFHDLRHCGYSSLSCDKPLYYHDAHYSLRELDRLGLPSKTDERGAVFAKYWGATSGWWNSISIIKSTGANRLTIPLEL